MFEMYSTPLDVLYLVLSIAIGLTGIFLVMALFHIVKILANLNKVTSKAKDTMDLVNHYLWQPIKIALMVIEKIKVAKNKKED
jgi:predicted permease